jgi:DNA-binding transcriptional regulator of glucitol operon
VITEYFWFFLALAVALGGQVYLSARQAKSLMTEVARLRRSGRVAIGLGGRKWLGRKAYVALCMDSNRRVIDAVVLRGLTQFARPRPAEYLVGLTTKRLAASGDVPGADTIERQAARQAAQTLNASGGWQPTGGVKRGEEGVRTASNLGS